MSNAPNITTLELIRQFLEAYCGASSIGEDGIFLTIDFVYYHGEGSGTVNLAARLIDWVESIGGMAREVESPLRNRTRVEFTIGIQQDNFVRGLDSHGDALEPLVSSVCRERPLRYGDTVFDLMGGFSGKGSAYSRYIFCGFSRNGKMRLRRHQKSGKINKTVEVWGKPKGFTTWDTWA